MACGGVVSRETHGKLEIFAELLRKWSKAKNLVAPATLPDLWRRHIEDSLQLLPLIQGARVIADIGSGGGFPGLVLAIAAAESDGPQFHLVDPDHRKCAFLREAARATGARALVHRGHAETVLPRIPDIDIVTARALAPLDKLVEMSKAPLSKGATGLFMKGKEFRTEVAALAGDPHLRVECLPSATDPAAAIIRVSAAQE